MTVNLVAIKATRRASGAIDVAPGPAPAYADSVKTATALAVTDNTNAAYTTVAANIATLVADGATPTQAHVTTLNTNWGTLKALIDTQTTDTTAADTKAGADQTGCAAAVVVTFDTVVFSDKGRLQAAFKAIVDAILGTGYLTS